MTGEVPDKGTQIINDCHLDDSRLGLLLCIAVPVVSKDGNASVSMGNVELNLQQHSCEKLKG
jgi:hypothetical protein